MCTSLLLLSVVKVTDKYLSTTDGRSTGPVDVITPIVECPHPLLPSVQSHSDTERKVKNLSACTPVVKGLSLCALIVKIVLVSNIFDLLTSKALF